MFEDFEIEIHCPECDVALDVKLSQIKQHESITCPECHKTICMKPDEAPSAAETQAVENSFGDIRKSIALMQKPQDTI